MSAVEARVDSDEALVGRVIARKFRLVRLLGAGGMGAVYEAEDLLMKRRVALKLMKPEVATNQGLVQRFIREARAADSIQHPNIVRVLDLAADDDSGSFYIVQELLSGESLADRLDRERRFSSTVAVSLMGPVLDALYAAHERGIVHRDVKPENVFLHRDPSGAEVPKLIDFGISKMNEGGAGLAKTQTGTALGTPYYMSPEQVRGDSNIDSRADLWSAGVMLFELVTGRRPFLGDNYNLLILKIMTDRAPRADQVDPAVSRALSNVIEKALEPDRSQRYPTARALREALTAALVAEADEAPVLVTRPSGVELRADAPTMDAMHASQTDARAIAATMVADAIEPAPVTKSSVAALSADSSPSVPSVVAAAKRRPRGGVLAGGALLAVAVSALAVVGVRRPSGASSERAPEEPRPAPVVQPALDPPRAQPAVIEAPAPRPVEPAAVVAVTVDAGAPPRSFVGRARNRPTAVAPRAPVAASGAAAAPAATPTPASTPTAPGGFRPISTYP
jgi:serine/threonine protein kinase